MYGNETTKIKLKVPNKLIQKNDFCLFITMAMYEMGEAKKFIISQGTIIVAISPDCAHFAPKTNEKSSFPQIPIIENGTILKAAKINTTFPANGKILLF